MVFCSEGQNISICNAQMNNAAAASFVALRVRIEKRCVLLKHPNQKKTPIFVAQIQRIWETTRKG